LGAWSVHVEDLAGAIRAFVDADSLTWARRWNGGAELAFRLPVDDANAGELQVASRVLVAYQDGALRFRGRVNAPLVRDQDWITVRAADPWFDLMGRTMQAAATFTAQDAGAIAVALIATQDARRSTRIAAGTIAASVPRTVTYDAGKNVAEAIAELAAMDDGFGFTIEPVRDPAALATLGRLNVRYPAVNADQPDVRFEYGDGTLDNLEGFREELGLPINHVRASTAPDSTGTRLQTDSASAASQATYDLWDSELALNDVTSSAIAQARGDAALQPDPPATWAVTPAPSSPILGRDFDAGDLVRLTLRRGAVDVTGTALVSEAVLQVDNDASSERLASLVLVSPTVNRVPRAPGERLYDLLGAYARRLAVLERAPLRGR
jgi:hypothetical protein